MICKFSNADRFRVKVRMKRLEIYKLHMHIFKITHIGKLCATYSVQGCTVTELSFLTYFVVHMRN